MHLLYFWIIVVGLAAALWLASRLVRLLWVATGLTSHTLASAVFVCGLDAASVYRQTLARLPRMGLVRWAMRYRVDFDRREVRVKLLGHFKSRTVFRSGWGCLLVRGEEAPEWDPPAVASIPPRQAERHKPTNPLLETALDRAFAFRGLQGWINAVVVLHDGVLVAERYAPGYGPDTPLPGWSVTKSVMNALIGILVRQGRLSVEQRAAVLEWQNPRDPRHAITVDHLLQMRSGLAFAETHSGFDPVSRMLYLERDMAGFVARARLRATPGTEWYYSGGNTLILSGIIRDLLGGSPRSVLQFAREELFTPTGMYSPVLEFDAAGTPIGSTYLFASARDWARFGQLYLDNGVVNGRRILPDGWLRYSSTPTAGSNYAAGFWTVQDDWGMPRDTLLARGFLGQAVVIVPSERLVLVRLGEIFVAEGDRGGLARLLVDVIQALHAPSTGSHLDPVTR